MRRNAHTALVLAGIGLCAPLSACRSQRSSAPLAAFAGVVQCPSVTLAASSGEDEVHDDTTVSSGVPAEGGDDSLRFAWTASAGRFVDPGASTTVFRCPLSPATTLQTITLVASRGSCVVTQQIVVICAPHASVVDGLGGVPGGGGDPLGGGLGGSGGAVAGDADGGIDGVDTGGEGGGGPLASDAGDGGGEAGPSLICGVGDSTIDEGEACNSCTLDNCTTLESARSGVPATDGCHHLASDADRVRCEALYCCIRSHGCVIAGDATPCWCGTTDPAACTQGTAAATGPCRAEFEAAAGTAEASQIALVMVDPTLPIGGAVNLAVCRANFCASPPSPACLGFPQ